MGKHVTPERQRARNLRFVVLAVALSIAAAGGLVALRMATSPPASAGAAVAVSSEEHSEPQLSVPGIARLVVYGHSMPRGGGASDPSKGYAVLTADALGLKLVNHAEGGSGAANATKTMEAARPVGRHDAVVLHTGMNDIFRRGADAVTRGRLAIRHFLEGTEDAGRRVVVLECQPGSWKYTPPGRNLQTAYDAWNDMLREEVSAAPHAQLLDTCASWDPQQFTSVQRYHPNDEGHARMAADLAALLARS